jgi:hypothetical protein
MVYTLRQAATATGKHRSSLLRCIQNGTLSATRDPVSGSWLIEVSELHRVFAPIASTGDSAEHRSVRDHEHSTAHSTVQTAGNPAGHKGVRGAAAFAEIRELRARLVEKDTQLADLKHRLDRCDEERRQVQAQLTALLTDQRSAPPVPARRWWNWRRQG